MKTYSLTRIITSVFSYSETLNHIRGTEDQKQPGKHKKIRLKKYYVIQNKAHESATENGFQSLVE